MERQFLLYTLNEHLARTAVLVQPLALPGGDGGRGGASGSHLQLTDAPSLVTIDVPLPLAPSPAAAVQAGRQQQQQDTDQPGHGAAQQPEGSGSGWNPFEDAPAAGSARGSSSTNAAQASSSSALPERAVGYFPDGESQEVALPAGLAAALQRLGLGRSLGFVRLLQQPRAGGGSSSSSSGSAPAWLPLALWLGMPMAPSSLCHAVCNAALAADFLDAPARAAQREGQAALTAALAEVASQYGACSTGFAGGSRDDDLGSYVDRPTRNLRFAGGVLAPADDLAPVLDGAMLLTAAAAS